MGVLSHLEPGKVFHFFEEICNIPHGSGNIDRISDYLAAFAGQRGLFCIQDEIKNIIIVKEAAPGMEQEPPLILQGHMDMVAVKKPECAIDMKTQGLKLAVEGDFVYAEGTSLGGDDGIAVAYALALLDSSDIRHPRLEVVITVDEEVGMDGAREIDLSMLKASRLLNIDSEEEGIFLTSCAGGARVDCHVPLKREVHKGLVCRVVIGGLTGGHSGMEIIKERGNANMLMGRLLWRLGRSIETGICECAGGLADNAIARETNALLLIEEKNREKAREMIQSLEKEIQEELAVKDKGVFITCDFQETKELSCVWGEEALKCAGFLAALPGGVQSMSADVEGLVETSLNLGILKLKEDGIHAGFSVRSCVESAKAALISRMEAGTWQAGGIIRVTGDYPGWKYRADSPLREKMISLYKRMYGESPRVEAIHAGLECGLLGSKIKDLDCVSFGPNMKDIHTTEEVLSISSVRRVWEYIVQLVEEKEKA